MLVVIETKEENNGEEGRSRLSIIVSSQDYAALRILDTNV